MKIRRPFLHPALALTLISLASGLSVPCATAESSVRVSRGSQPVKDLPGTSGSSAFFGLEKVASAPTSHGRWTPATSAVSHRQMTRLTWQALYQRASTLTLPALSTPLYLRYCSILR